MIIPNDRYAMHETESSMYAVTMTLTIKHLQKSDFGGYKCISKNSIGGIEATIRLYGKLCTLFILHHHFNFNFRFHFDYHKEYETKIVGQMEFSLRRQTFRFSIIIIIRWTQFVRLRIVQCSSFHVFGFM